MRRDRMSSSGSHGSNGNELRLERLLHDFTYIRISIDHIEMTAPSDFIERLQSKGSLFGYTLQYSFPCPDGVSASLRHKVRLRASSFTSNAIYFRHKRVNLVKLNSDVIPLWSRSHLALDLEAQLNLQGKYSSRPLGRCLVPLEDLLIPPFCISRDFDFVGHHFEGAALIKIDLGSQQRALMERLERWRGEGEERSRNSEETFTIPPGRHTRSRSGSRCRNRPEDPADMDDDVFIDEDRSESHTRRVPSPFRVRQPSSIASSNPSFYARPTVATRSTVSSISSLRDAATIKQSLKVKLVVHAASGLPMARDERGLLISPSSLVSVRGRDGELRSPITPSTRNPRFDWTCTFFVSGERRNIVVKVLHIDREGNDVPLGFVSLSLPMANVAEADYELVDLSGGTMNDAATITLSVDISSSRPPSKLDNIYAPVPVSRPPDDRYYRPPSGMSGQSSMTMSTMRRERTEERGRGIGSGGGFEGEYRRRRSLSPPDVLILESKEEIENRLRRNMNELDMMMRRLERR